jgi:hypothetical protein
VSCKIVPDVYYKLCANKTGVITYGAIRTAYREAWNRSTRRCLIVLFPEAFRLKGFFNRFKYNATLQHSSEPEGFVTKEIMGMSETKKKFAMRDNAVVTLTAGHLRKCAEKMCSDWKQGLQTLFPEVFERIRAYPNLSDGCFVKTGKGTICLIREDSSDHTWRYIDLKTGKAGDWKSVFNFEAVLLENDCIIITKEEALGLL